MPHIRMYDPVGIHPNGYFFHRECQPHADGLDKALLERPVPEKFPVGITRRSDGQQLACIQYMACCIPVKPADRFNINPDPAFFPK